MKITQSSDISKLFSELLVTKNKVARIIEFYSQIRDNLTGDINAFKVRLEEDILWMQSNVDIISDLFAQVTSTVNDFLAQTTDEFIEEHEEYQKMIDLYNTYIHDFYDRMNELYDLYEEQFLSSKINDAAKIWKFYYYDNRTDALNIRHQIASININEESSVLEISHNRFLVFNNDNTIYDMDYKTHNCYVCAFDAKTVTNAMAVMQGSSAAYYCGDNSRILQIFTLQDKNEVYAALDIGHNNSMTDYFQGDVIGTVNDGPVHLVIIGKYDIDKKTISFDFNYNNPVTSVLLIRDAIVRECKFTVLYNNFQDYYFGIIGKYLLRLKFDASNQTNISAKILLTNANNFSDVQIFDNRYLVAAAGGSSKILTIYDLTVNVTNLIPYVSISTTNLNLLEGDNGVINAVLVSSYAIYFTTYKSLWEITNNFEQITRDDRMKNLGVPDITFENKLAYKMDNEGMLFYIHNHNFLYSVKKNGVSVMSPTNYADKLLFLSNQNKSSLEGYAYQIDDTLYPNDKIVYSFIEDDIYTAILSTGRVLSCIIHSGTWNAVKQSIIQNKSCASFYAAVDGTLYIGTSDGFVYYIAKRDVYLEGIQAALLYASDMGSIFSLYQSNNILYMGGYNGRVSVYDITHSEYHPYNELGSLYCVESGHALGFSNVRFITSIGPDLIIAGNHGRVASANLTTKRWTRYDGFNALDGSTDIDARIYNNGSALGNADITCACNYLNRYLILFGNNGRIASFDLRYLVWVNYLGNSETANVTPPPLFNNGSAVNNKAIRAVLQTNYGLLAASDYGYIISINTKTGGITCYNKLNADPDRAGPGICFDSSGYLKNIYALAFDIERNNVIFGGQNGCVLTLNLTDNEILLPFTNNLYYIGRKNSQNDFLSSLLVQISKESFREAKIFIPPREEDEINTPFYNNDFYVYKNGEYVYQLAADFTTVRRSVDRGVSFTGYEINNTDWVLSPNSLTVVLPKGFVTKEGVFGFYAKINGIHRFMFTYIEGNEFKSRWFTPQNYSNNIINFGMLESSILDKYLFYVSVKNPLNSALTYPVLLHINSDTAITLDDSISVSEIEDNRTMNDDTIHISMDSRGNVFTANESKLNIIRWNFDTYGLSPVLNSSISKYSIASDFITNPFFKLFFYNRALYSYIQDWSADSINLSNKYHSFIVFYALTDSVFNYMFASKEGNILIVTITKFKKDPIRIPDDITDGEGWGITIKELDASEYIPLHGNNVFLNKTGFTLSPVTVKPKYTVLMQGNQEGFIGFDVSYWEVYSADPGEQAGYNERHVVLSINTQVCGNYIFPEYRVFKSFTGKGTLISCDETYKEILIASYNKETAGLNNAGDFIPYVREIYKVDLIDAPRYTPLRALSDAWYETSLIMYPNDSNAFRLRAKVQHLTSDASVDIIDRQFSFRYEALVINETLGEYILFETEKSTVNSRMEEDSKAITQLLRVKAVDNFNDDIIELFSSRFNGRQTALFSAPSIHPFYQGKDFEPKQIAAFDFLTLVQLGKENREKLETLGAMFYTVKIRPLSTLPSTVDVQFYIEPYHFNEEASGVIKSITNKINRSEYKAVDILYTDAVEKKHYSEYVFGETGGFLHESSSDLTHLTAMMNLSNHELYPQYTMIPPYSKSGYIDTYVSYIKGRNKGRYDRIDGIVGNVGSNVWSVIPFSVNRKPVRYYIDSEGTKHIDKQFDLTFLKNGRNINKMREFGIYSPGVINIADYYIDFNSQGRIAKSEGLITNQFGVYEGISTLDGKQKRITALHENIDHGMYRYIKHALDSFRERLYGYAYDIIDRYTIFEIPYYYIRSWWIPGSGYITHNNESLLSLDYDEARYAYSNIGQALFPFDVVSPPPSISKPAYEDAGGGIGSGITINGPDIIAFSQLIREKYPLTRWEGYNDLDFVHVWKDVYMDGRVEERFIVEQPHTIVPRSLYYYRDTLDWERRGTETLKYMTGYYYTSYNWKIYYHEVREITSGYPAVYDERPDYLMADYNESVVLQDIYIEKQWYINEKPQGSALWPYDNGAVIGERITHMTNPLVEGVFFMNVNEQIKHPYTGEWLYPNYDYFEFIHRGTREYYEKGVLDSGHTLFYLPDLITNRKNVLSVNKVTAPTFNREYEPLINQINELNSRIEKYITIVLGQDSISINSSLRAAFNSIGGTLTAAALEPDYRSHLVIGSTQKDPNTQYEFLGEDNGQGGDFYTRGLGFIAPLKTESFNNTDIISINDNFVWVASIKKYRADCAELTENRNMSVTTGDKTYDRYAGHKTHKYLYGTKKTVSLSLEGINPRTQLKDFYYYTIENGTPAVSSYYNLFNHWWDHRAPDGNSTADVVEIEYIGRIDPAEDDKELKYIFREWLNNGISRDVISPYTYYTRWFEINENSNIIIPIADEAGELLDDYRINGIARWKYFDGTISSDNKTFTFRELMDIWNITITIDVAVMPNNNDGYDITRTMLFIGPQVNNGSANTITKVLTTTATYTADRISSAGAAASNQTGTRAIKWE